MMVAVSCSGLCSTYAIFELKDDNISQLFYSVIVYGTFLEDSQSKPLFQDCTILYSCSQYQLDVSSTLSLIQDVPESCFPVSSPLKPYGNKPFFFICRRCQYTSNSNLYLRARSPQTSTQSMEQLNKTGFKKSLFLIAKCW